jgi:capsular polysaccharide biosynthesis protein
MDIFRYIVRFLYKIRWYLVILPLIALVVAWFMTRNMERIYDANTTIYTGMITGYSIEGTGNAGGGNGQTNIVNLMLIIQTDATIHEVALRLFARCMLYGNVAKDNNYITAEHFRQLKDNVPADVQALIQVNEEESYNNLKAYEKPSKENYLYNLLNNHPYFSINSITSRLKVLRLEQSDIIDIAYSANDPGICYNTLDILNKVFANQYQQLRYGETLNVIKFFEREVNKLSRTLNLAENDLINYNIRHRIINYGEQTKQLTVLDMQQQNAENELRKNLRTTEALIAYLRQQLGNRQQLIESNEEFTSIVRDISRLQSRIANLRLMGSELSGGSSQEAQLELARAEQELAAATTRVRELTAAIEAATYNTDTGIKASDLIGRWLEQVLILEQTKAELGAYEIFRAKLDEQYKFYSPLGATIDRKARHIGFIEGNYMEMLKALNAARLRQRNLQMSTATLKQLNPPTFPLNAQPTNRMMVLLGAFMLTFFLTALYFFIIEMLDRTLRDRMRSERITKVPVMGCYPRESTMRYRRFNKTISDMALRQLSKSLLPYFKEGQQNVLNLLSTDAGNGKSHLAEELENYWLSIGLQVRRLTYDEDFLADDSRYVMASDIKDLCPDILPNEIAIVEYPNLDDNSISSSLLNMGTVNLMVTRANRTWKDVDQKALKELQARLDDDHKNTLFMYLTEAQRYAVEEFVGQLPPYTKFNNFVYRISQMGLTAVENNRAK